MELTFAFTAQFWGDGAVVCRAIRDRPGPVVEQQFGEFRTWTQAQNFASKLNEGLDLDPLEARNIVVSSLLATACVVQQAFDSRHSWRGSPVELKARAAQLRCILSELGLAVTLCRSAANLPDGPAQRNLLNAQKILRHSAHFITVFDGDDCPELKEIASRTQELDATLQRSLPACPPAYN
ncbi:MAG TPA: hypothetical protein VJN89_21680 [Candidatus Acidoferrum sp.]|nr:hypothetical protein [Candidatus Acidoferrum sp.]